MEQFQGHIKDPYQLSRMELFVEIVVDFESLNVFVKNSILDV